ncbi:MAG TPA: DinB family protein [Candidatus Binatia bacterium]|nr:DinB family protein [Candidatus Binatia bacterium]
MTNLLDDAFRHHAWANDRILEACANLTPEQLTAPVPGTFGPILDTLRHLIGSDNWYLWVITDGRHPEIDEDNAGIPELQAGAKLAAKGWADLLAGDVDPDAMTIRRGEDWEFHAPLGVRLAQAIHHGTDHRSQVCTGLTSLDIEPPDIDLWAWAEATGRAREVRLAPTE